MTRAVACVDQNGRPAADDALCTGAKPAAEQACNLERCGGACASGCLGRGSCGAGGSCACTGGYSGAYCQVLLQVASAHMGYWPVPAQALTAPFSTSCRCRRAAPAM